MNVILRKNVNRIWLVILTLAIIVTSMGLSTAPASATSGTFNISSSSAGYSSYSPFLNGIYNSNKSSMDGAAEWKFTQPNSSAPMVVGKSYSASYDADLTLPASLEKITGYGTTAQGTELSDSGNLWVSYTGGKVVFPAGINITVYNIWFSCDVYIESGAIVIFEECGFDTEPSITNGQVQAGAGKVVIDNKVVRDGVQTYSVTYKDGVGGTAFSDQVTSDLKENDTTPSFSGVPTRDGYDFIGWEPEVSEKVTKDSIYTAVWEEKAPEHVKSISVNDRDSSKGTLTLNVTGKEEKGTSGTGTSDETKVDVVFVVDASGSMSLEYDAQATDYYGNRYTKAEAAIRALISRPSYTYEGMLADLINDDSVDARAAIVSFSDSGKIEEAIVNNLSDLYSATWKCKGTGETNIEDGLVKAEQALANARADAKRVVVLLTDGEPNRYNGGGSGAGNYVQEAGDAAIAQAKKMKAGVDEFYAIGYGSGYNSNGSGFLQSLADEFGGSMLSSAGGTALKTVLSDIKTQAVKPLVKEDKTLRGITIKDELSDDVEIDGSFEPTVKLDNDNVDKENYTATESNGTITVKFKDDFVVPKDNVLSVSFDVKVKDDKGPGTYKTNKKAELTYVFGDSSADSKIAEYIEEPELTKEAEYTFALKHDVNGGTGTVDDVTKTSKNDSEKLAVSSTVPTRANYTFKGWADSAGAVTAKYQAGDEINLTSDSPTRMIYAVWKENDKTTYKVTFKVVNGKWNNDTGGEVAVEYTDYVAVNQYLELIKVPAVGNKPDAGYKAGSWDTEPDTVTPLSKDVIYTYTYNAQKFTVIFEDGYGNVLDTQTVEYGKSATSPAAPSRDNSTFDGWDKTFNNITGDLTVTAKWKQNTVVKDEPVKEEPKEEPKKEESQTKPLQKIEPPKGVNSTYNGSVQTGVKASTGYTVSGGSATNAGTYTAIATLKSGFVWSDGSSAPKKISFTIKKAKLTATYVSETIDWFDAPANKIKITGFKGKDTAKTAKGYKSPSLKGVNVKPHKTYIRVPVGGKADNYTFKYVKGKLIVKCKDILVLTTTDGNRKLNLRWTEVHGADGYMVYGNLCNEKGKEHKPKYVKTIKGGAKLKTIIKNVKKDEYKYYVVAYKKVNGKVKKLAKSNVTHTMVNNSQRRLTNTVKVTVNKKAVSLKKGKKTTIKGNIIGKNRKKTILWKTHCSKVSYLSSDAHIAKVDKKGKITATGKGKCKIYVIAANGIWKSVAVTVK